MVSLDDLLAVVREFLNPDVSRSGLDWCLRRHEVGNLRDLQAVSPRPQHKAFKTYEPVRIPEHMATDSDNIRPPVPGDVSALEVPLLSIGS